MLAVAGVAMVAATSTQAQVASYSDGDILLLFRNTANITGTDLEVDLGPASGLAGDNGTVVVSANTFTSVYSAPSTGQPIGMSAAGSFLSTDELYLTRQQTGTTEPTHQSDQENAATQTPVANAISAIGNGAVGATAGPVVGSALVPGGNANSYQSQAEQNSGGQSGVINYGGVESTSTLSGGKIESVNNGASTVYEALWDVPASDSANPAETYLGYFTFLPTGQVDFTSVTAVPEPSTYGLLAATGLLAVALRRQFRSLAA